MSGADSSVVYQKAEALIVVGRPVLGTLVLTIIAVALAYYLGEKRVLKVSLADALRDDTMM